MKWHYTILIMLIVLPAAAATADWEEVVIKFSWDRSSYYYCDETTQCLVHEDGNPENNNDVYKYYETTIKADWPRCVESGQYIFDYYCENGKWTTRTKLIANQLIQVGNDLSQDYSVYCANYKETLNNYQYIVDNKLIENYLKDQCVIAGQRVNCTNNFCVLNTGDAVAFGTSLNPLLEEQQRQFFTAIGEDEDICDGTSENQFNECSEEVWYNPELKLVVFAPQGALSDTGNYETWFFEHRDYINDYLMAELHDPDSRRLNFAYFDKTSLFNNIYFAKSGNKLVFGFLEENIKEDNSDNPAPMDFIGVRYANIDLGAKPCDDLIKKYDDRAFCEEQTGSSFNVVGRHREQSGASPIVQAWNDLTGKLRLQ